MLNGFSKYGCSNVLFNQSYKKLLAVLQPQENNYDIFHPVNVYIFNQTKFHEDENHMCLALFFFFPTIASPVVSTMLATWQETHTHHLPQQMHKQICMFQALYHIMIFVLDFSVQAKSVQQSIFLITETVITDENGELVRQHINSHIVPNYSGNLASQSKKKPMS